MMVLLDARMTPVEHRVYLNLNAQILGGIIQALGPPSLEVLAWSYDIYNINTRKHVYDNSLRYLYKQ